MNYINPYYSSQTLGLEQFELDKSSGCYEYDTICFWATKNGKVYTASDSGCSCPTPFEGYSGENLDTILQKLERVESAASGMRLIDSWIGGDAYYKDRITDEQKKKAKAWFKKHLKKQS